MEFLSAKKVAHESMNNAMNGTKYKGIAVFNSL